MLMVGPLCRVYLTGKNIAPWVYIPLHIWVFRLMCVFMVKFRTTFLAEIEAFKAHTGLRLATISKRAECDSKMLARFVSKGGVGVDNADRIRVYMNQHLKDHGGPCLACLVEKNGAPS